jgi:hypothetical protein
MPIELTNAFGKVYLTIEYDSANHWVYNNWMGYLTYNGVVEGSDACLRMLAEHACPYVLNDNRQVVGRWDHAVVWLVTDWAPRASTQGVTHCAHVVSPEATAADSAETVNIGLEHTLNMRIFDNITDAQAWLHEAEKERCSRLR